MSPAEIRIRKLEQKVYALEKVVYQCKVCHGVGKISGPGNNDMGTWTEIDCGFCDGTGISKP
jgi:hypothetical protein